MDEEMKILSSTGFENLANNFELRYKAGYFKIIMFLRRWFETVFLQIRHISFIEILTVAARTGFLHTSRPLGVVRHPRLSLLNGVK